MKIVWLGHAGFRIEIAGQVLLVDPWVTGNPVFPEDRRAEAIAGATHLLLTHGHFDHIHDADAVVAETGAKVCAIPELAYRVTSTDPIAFNKGGTIHLGEVAVTMVHAVHSSSIPSDEGGTFAGSECGFMIAGEGHTIYVSGDTDVMADMGVFNDLHSPDIGILAAGGHYTMDMARAAYAAKTFFAFKTVIPCHYKTFPALAQSAQPLIDALPGVDVRTPDVLEPMTF